MSLEENIKKRVSIIIIDLVHQFELSNVKLSQILDCNRNTVSNQRNALHVPRLTFITKLAMNFNVNLDWVYFGKGQKYLDAHPKPLRPLPASWADDSKSDGKSKSKEEAESAAKSKRILDKACRRVKNERVRGALIKTAKILSSDTAHASYLFANIEYLGSAVETERKRVRTARGFARLRREAATVTKQVANLARRSSKSKRPKRKSPSKR